MISGYLHCYNANGMRTQKKVGSKVTDYYYDSNNNLIAEKTDSATLFFYYDTENSPVALSYNGKMFYYVKNLQGDIVKILDEDGNEKASYVYNAWGNILSQSEDELSSINPLRYRGYVYDEDTTLYYLQTRYYDPTTGRFINADNTIFIGSSGTAIGDNIFTYCENNPINFRDPTGKWCISVGIEGQAAFVFGVYFAVALNIDNKWNISLTIATGLQIITNASASFSGYVAFYTNKTVNSLSVWGVSTGASWSIGVKLGGSASFNIGLDGNLSGSGSVSVGVGASLVPIPYLDVRMGYTFEPCKTNLKKYGSGKIKSLLLIKKEVLR